MAASTDSVEEFLIWLKLTKSNNDPRIIDDFFLNAILERDGFPTLIRTDRGTENGIMATVQCFLRRNDTDSQSGINAHRYESSHSDPRVGKSTSWRWSYVSPKRWLKRPNPVNVCPQKAAFFTSVAASPRLAF